MIYVGRSSRISMIILYSQPEFAPDARMSLSSFMWRHLLLDDLFRGRVQIVPSVQLYDGYH